MLIINQDILEISNGIICHQVNCKGVMGAGLALAIRKKWPVVYQAYMNKFKMLGWHLGDVQVVPVSPYLSVCNVAGQYGFGRNQTMTDMSAVHKAFTELAAHVVITSTRPFMEHRCIGPIFIPYKMGCGLGGGNWTEYVKIIEKHIPNAIICKLSH